MNTRHNDSELYNILHFTPEVSGEVSDKILSAYDKIRFSAAHDNTIASFTHDKIIATSAATKPRFRIKRNLCLYLGAAAAFVIAAGLSWFNGSVMAANIAIVGNIFHMTEDKISYPGNFSDNPILLSPVYDNADSADNGSNTDNIATTALSQTSGDITVTLSEASYTDMALYYSLELYSETGFPQDFDKVKNMKDYTLSYNVLNMRSSQRFDFSNSSKHAAKGLQDNQDNSETSYGSPKSGALDMQILDCSIENGRPSPYSIEGIFVDEHTFAGVIRIDMEEIKDILNADTLPDEFTYSITIEKFWGTLNEYDDVSITDPETKEVTVIKEAVRKYYEGPWTFTIPVPINAADTQVYEIEKTNKDGVGISSVTKTPYELKADIILPQEADPADYIVVITDADGRILDSQGDNAEIYSTFGRDINTINVYVADYYTYMNECKADNAGRLPAKALFKTTVNLSGN